MNSSGGAIFFDGKIQDTAELDGGREYFVVPDTEHANETVTNIDLIVAEDEVVRFRFASPFTFPKGELGILSISGIDAKGMGQDQPLLIYHVNSGRAAGRADMYHYDPETHRLRAANYYGEGAPRGVAFKND